MKKIMAALLLLSLGACNSIGSRSASDLYSGSETGSWYSMGASCVNGVCPIN